MIELCRKAGKIVIVATQMLDSMETRIAPSRAEVTDVFYAGHLGTDATMLSGETAQGAFPVEAVETMATINRESEFLFNYDKAITKFKNNKAFGEEARKIAIQIAKKTAPSKQKTLAASFPYELVVLFTNKDEVVRAVSSIRPGAAVVVVCDSESM
jgi:pyruvate kinase